MTATPLPGQSTADLLKAVRVQDGKRLPGPVVQAGHLHDIEREGVHNNLASWAQIQALITCRERNVKSKHDQVSMGGKSKHLSQRKECLTREKSAQMD